MTIAQKGSGSATLLPSPLRTLDGLRAPQLGIAVVAGRAKHAVAA